MMPKYVPYNYVGILKRTVSLGPLRQSFAARVLIGIRASRKIFVRVIRRHPQVLSDKPGPFENRSIRVSKRQDVFARDELEAGGLTQAILHVGIHHPPIPSLKRVDQPLRRLF